MITQLKGYFLASLCFFVAFIAMPSKVSSALLWPFEVGYTYKYIEQDEEEAPTFEYLTVKEMVSMDSVEYFRITPYDPEEGTSADQYIRSTEDAIYKLNPDGDEILIFQSGNTGTTWHNLHDEDGEGLYYYFYEIVDDNATVTFLFGHSTLTGGYKYRIIHKCTDLEQTDCTLEDQVDWIVPGVGWVKADERASEGNYYIELYEIIPPIKGDYDHDGDVDGSDLYFYINSPGDLGLGVFSGYFGAVGWGGP